MGPKEPGANRFMEFDVNKEIATLARTYPSKEIQWPQPFSPDTFLNAAQGLFPRARSEFDPPDKAAPSGDDDEDENEEEKEDERAVGFWDQYQGPPTPPARIGDPLDTTNMEIGRAHV